MPPTHPAELKPLPAWRAWAGVAALVIVTVGGLVGVGRWRAGAFVPPAALGVVDEWEPFAPDGVGCVVEFPDVPDERPFLTVGFGDLPGYSTHRAAPFERFALTSAPAATFPDGSILRSFCDRYQLVGERETDVTADGCRGRELCFRARGAGVGDIRGVARALVVGSRVCLLVAAGEGFDPGGARARRFLDSFALTPGMRAMLQEEADDATRERWAAGATRFLREWQAAWRERQRAAFDGVAPPPRGGLDRDDLARLKAKGLAAFFPFEGDAGSPIPDGRVLFARPARPNGVMPDTTPGVAGRALAFREASPEPIALAVADGQFRANRRGTVCFWLRTPAPRGHVLATPTAALGFDGGTLTVGRWPPRGFAGDPRGIEWPADAGWHHVAVVTRSQGRGFAVRFYLDGRPGEEFADFEDGLLPMPSLTLNPVQRGSPGFVGAIDELCVFHDALDDATIADIAGAEVPE